MLNVLVVFKVRVLTAVLSELSVICTLLCHLYPKTVLLTVLVIYRLNISLCTYRILFAEAFPPGWEDSGRARILLSQFWKFAVMLVIAVYLCNLRSHLIRGLKTDAPDSFHTLAASEFSYKLHGWYGMDVSPAGKMLVQQGRFVRISCNVFNK